MYYQALASKHLVHISNTEVIKQNLKCLQTFSSRHYVVARVTNCDTKFTLTNDLSKSKVSDRKANKKP